MGGNLSHMIAIPSASKEFEKPRPAFTEWTDEYGYSNPPSTTNRYYRIVVVGDSFMMVPDVQSDQISAQLERISSLPVYNHACKGRGPLLGLIKFFSERRFECSPPKVLVFGMVEADISGPLYVGLMYHLEHLDDFTKKNLQSTGIRWPAFCSNELKKSLPNTSLLAQVARNVWNQIRYFVLGNLTPDVIPSQGKVTGAPLLFYRYNIESIKWGTNRGFSQLVDTLGYLDRYCRLRGISLIVMLIPDKESVYREYLPSYANPPDNPLPPSCLPALEAVFKDAGIAVINLLEPFRAQAARGRLLYWPDDTHWNSEGIQVAAELLWKNIQPLLSAHPRSINEGEHVSFATNNPAHSL